MGPIVIVLSPCIYAKNLPSTLPHLFSLPSYPLPLPFSTMSFDESPMPSEESPLLEETDDDHVVFMGEEPEEPSRFISPTKSKRSSTRPHDEWSAADRFWTWLCASAGVFVLVLLLVIMKRSIARNSPLAANIGGGEELNLHKSPNDARSYEYTVLDNGLQVLLVSLPMEVWLWKAPLGQ